MPVDPTDPETFETDDDQAPDPEASEADLAEQHTGLTPTHDDPLTDLDPTAADPADVTEQSRVVELDEDDYR
ncbi:hypothetical protein [Kitasatospora sp. MAP5-34]|uniref:hypothetical protein n=1 Tax=Kitasatospora sp. MAP5-34 TaxID=3035102 RepID=UPI00247716C2|nr:hypothetical protein [Kitasatospora sp. MAP5-34]